MTYRRAAAGRRESCFRQSSINCLSIKEKFLISYYRMSHLYKVEKIFSTSLITGAFMEIHTYALGATLEVSNTITARST